MIYILRYILLRESRHVRKIGISGKALERYTDPIITSVKSENLSHIICTALRNATGLSGATTKDNEAIFR
jgi:alanyl-tRNA synthetase